MLSVAVGTLSRTSLPLRCPIGDNSEGGSGGVRGMPLPSLLGTTSSSLCTLESVRDGLGGRPRGTVATVEFRCSARPSSLDNSRPIAEGGRGPSSSLDESDSTGAVRLVVGL